MSVVVLFGGITSDFILSRLPSFPPGRAVPPLLFRWKGSMSTYLKVSRLELHLLLRWPRALTLRGSLWRAQWRLYETSHRLKVRKPAELRRCPGEPCTSLCGPLPCGPPQPWLSACSVESEECLVRSALSHRHSICCLFRSCAGSLLWCSGFLYLWLMWASPVALCKD